MKIPMYSCFFKSRFQNPVIIPVYHIKLTAAATVEGLSAEPCLTHNSGDAQLFKAFLPKADIRCFYKKQQILILCLI